MPVIGTKGSASLSSFGFSNAGSAAPSGGDFTISPSVDGKSSWTLATDGPLRLSSSGFWLITPNRNFTANIKVWGSGGGAFGVPPLAQWQGGGGGFSTGDLNFTTSTVYNAVVASGGLGVPVSNRQGGSGGAGSGIKLANDTLLIVAGGGGGGAGSFTGQGGAGGGLTGENGTDYLGGSQGGRGGTQSAAGAGGVGSRRTGAPGSGNNGGGGATNSPGNPLLAGGVGIGIGGPGSTNSSDAGSGGGGAGYYGGGEGGGDSAGYGGGGGSGFINISYISAGSTVTGSANVAANAGDSIRGSAGNGGNVTVLNGSPGLIYISL